MLPQNADQLIATVLGTLPSRANQTINFTAPASPITLALNQTITLAASLVTPRACRSLSSIDASSTAAGSINGNVLSVTGAGTFVLDANQSGNSSFNPAPQVQQTLVVNPAGTTTALSSSANPAVYGQPVVFTAAITTVNARRFDPGPAVFSSSWTALCFRRRHRVGRGRPRLTSLAESFTSGASHAVKAVYSSNDELRWQQQFAGPNDSVNSGRRARPIKPHSDRLVHRQLGGA